MIRRLPVLLFPLALAACVSAPPTEASGGVARCDVTIKFASYGAGIDQELSEKVAATVKADHDLADSERKPWGREGEYDLCLTAKAGRGQAVYERYKAMLPAKSLKAPTSIVGPNGERFESIGPM